MIIEHGYQMNITQNKITEWTGEAENVLEWWSGLLQGKQMLVNKHSIIACMSWSGIIQTNIAINQS